MTVGRRLAYEDLRQYDQAISVKWTSVILPLACGFTSTDFKIGQHGLSQTLVLSHKQSRVPLY